MRLVMIGTGPFGVPTLHELYDTHHAVVALVTGPTKSKRPKSVLSPIRDLAHQHATPIFEPEDVNSQESLATLTGYKADLLMVCD